MTTDRQTRRYFYLIYSIVCFTRCSDENSASELCNTVRSDTQQEAQSDTELCSLPVLLCSILLIVSILFVLLLLHDFAERTTQSWYYINSLTPPHRSATIKFANVRPKDRAGKGEGPQQPNLQPALNPIGGFENVSMTRPDPFTRLTI